MFDKVVILKSIGNDTLLKVEFLLWTSDKVIKRHFQHCDFRWSDPLSIIFLLLDAVNIKYTRDKLILLLKNCLKRVLKVSTYLLQIPNSRQPYYAITTSTLSNAQILQRKDLSFCLRCTEEQIIQLADLMTSLHLQILFALRISQP